MIQRNKQLDKLLQVNMCPHRRNGFSALEVMFALMVIIGLFMVTNSYMGVMFKIKKNNQVADQINSYQTEAIKYVNDNYREIDQNTKIFLPSGYWQDMAVPVNTLKEYFYRGESKMIANFQAPCLYITRNTASKTGSNTNNYFNAYLVFGSLGNTGRNFTLLEAMKIARSIGGNAGVLVPGADGFIIQGMNNRQGTGLSYSWPLASQCGFVNGHGALGLLDYSIIVDLTKNSQLFAQLKTKSDSMSGTQESDPTLKKSSTDKDDTTMQTNLYLDNIVKESSATAQNYCDATKLPVNDANTMCQNYANAKGIFMYSGTSSWNSSVPNGNSCLATASAHFYASGTSCNMGDPAYFCPASLGGKIIAPGRASWNPAQPVPSGGKCT
ncbi:MAG: hypothetical protein K0R94_389, partial [Burkholderiales bacterium]|nr:hypothetical protein [Burkholderiales bacterium]